VQCKKATIPEVILIQPTIFEDERGLFYEVYQAKRYAQAGIPGPFVQDNQSSSLQGVLRGLHYQIKHPQGKLVCALSGTIFDVAVDLRRSSKTFGQWVGATISAENRAQIWIPPGFAHGFYVLSELAEILYKVTDYYTPEWDRTLIWNDPDLHIDWPLIDGKAPSLSHKDAAGLPLHRAEVFK